jgi:hypothetical protein
MLAAGAASVNRSDARCRLHRAAATAAADESARIHGVSERGQRELRQRRTDCGRQGCHPVAAAAGAA